MGRKDVLQRSPLQHIQKVSDFHFCTILKLRHIKLNHILNNKKLKYDKTMPGSWFTQCERPAVLVNALQTYIALWCHLCLRAWCELQFSMLVQQQTLNPPPGPMNVTLMTLLISLFVLQIFSLFLNCLTIKYSKINLLVQHWLFLITFLLAHNIGKTIFSVYFSHWWSCYGVIS